MLAAVYHGQRDVRVQQWDDPLPPGPEEVQLQVLRASLCGTDVDEFVSGPHLVPLNSPHAASGRRGPVVLGHEIVGRVVAAGTDVNQFGAGDVVVPGSGVSCGLCRWCAEGRTNLCERYYTVGLHVDGGLAERVNVPARICRPVGSMTEDVAIMAQPLAVALHAVRGTGARTGARVVVIGLGGIGALIVAACSARGIGTIAVDVSRARLETAERLGASLLVDASCEDAAAVIRRVTRGYGADIVIEASGARQGLGLAMNAVCRGGHVQLVGLHRDPSPLDLTRLVLDEIRISTSKVHVCHEDLPEALAMLAAHPHIASRTADRVIGLRDVVTQGFLRMAAGEVHGKVVVAP
ncbi:zinc-dependent alcohol dehydrogenase [Streptomyces poonensis]|uniref:2-deoxy-scyllo-inosamine dehydrogenase n=1 Tax=Streptomyces poonensis TaxID=68255 RepID=A0A918PU25_9ACTN|nr:alcohol dehydrogenase catalytic domain-containing protein [Streptomyces poonensis]GGZ21219.1 alcohol dehydrogenase [Streptomyces poonensis]